MEKMLERLEGGARQLVPVFYLLGLVTGTAYYFTDGGGDLGKYALAVGAFLALATELHSFLCQRRIFVAWSALRKAHDAASEDEAKRDLWMAAGWLVVLLGFQIFAAIMYRATVWHPSTALLPATPQIIIAGAVIPLFFFGVSFLNKVVIDPADVQAETQRTTAMKSAQAGQRVALRALDASTRSFQYRLRQAEKSHADLTGLAVSMQRRFGDDDGAQTLMVIDTELRGVEGQKPRQYAGVWTDPDAQAKAARAAAPPPVVTPPAVVMPRPAAQVAPAVVAAPAVPMAVLPDLTTLSDADLTVYAEDLEDRAQVPARQGPHFWEQLVQLGEELKRRYPADAASVHQSLAEAARRTGRPEPGRVARPSEEELDAMARDLGGTVV